MPGAQADGTLARDLLDLARKSSRKAELTCGDGQSRRRCKRWNENLQILGFARSWENIVDERCSFFRPAPLYEYEGLLGEGDDRQISTSDAYCLDQHVDLSHDLVPPSEVIERPGALGHQPPGVSTHAPGLGEIDSLAVDVCTLLRRSESRVLPRLL